MKAYFNFVLYVTLLLSPVSAIYSQAVDHTHIQQPNVNTNKYNLPERWVKTNLPGDAGNLNCLTSGYSYIFAGTTKGVYRSNNGGKNWTKVNGGLEFNVVALAVNDNFIFASSQGQGDFGPNKGFFRSNDEGISWERTNENVFSCLAVNGNNVYAVYNWPSGGVIYLSMDNGANWTLDNNGLNNAGIISSIAVNGANVFAGTKSNGVFLSKSDGTPWTQLKSNLIPSNINCLSVCGTSVFAGTNAGIFLSSDNGTNWNKVNDQVVNCFAVRANNICAGNTNVYLSTDNGITWTAVGQIDKSINSLTLSPMNTYAGTQNEGIWRMSHPLIKKKITSNLPKHKPIQNPGSHVY
ncbi:MAG: hypothetical protein P4L27_07900 [Ignavibacteriaceae bacterium]|nr:hypothetical protein [Ignavibacteriaceae bacterium]